MILSENEFDTLPALGQIKATERHKFTKFYALGDKVFMVSYPDRTVIDITEEYKKAS